MNNEIKEIKHILELLHFECNPKAREEDINKVLDYITKLQEENKRLKEKINNLEMFKYNIPNDKTKTVPTITKSYKNEYEEYKLKNEKAINEVIRILQIILEQPSKDKLDDLWIISKLKGIQILLQGEDK